MNDLTNPAHLNQPVPTAARWWECCGCCDYAWLWPGESAPAKCSCDDDDGPDDDDDA